MFRVSDYVGLTSNVQLRFIASDSLRPGQNLDGGSLIEAAIDDLMLYETQLDNTSINDALAIKTRLIKITDILGKEINIKTVSKHTTLLYIYNNGSVEKKIMLD